MYVVALVALLAMDTFRPQVYAPAKTIQECLETAGKFNEQYKDELKEEENANRGLHFVCMKVVAEV